MNKYLFKNLFLVDMHILFYIHTCIGYHVCGVIRHTLLVLWLLAGLVSGLDVIFRWGIWVLVVRVKPAHPADELKAALSCVTNLQ